MNKRSSHKKILFIASVALVVLLGVFLSSFISQKHKAALRSMASSLSPEEAAEAETEALSSHFVLPTDPDSRVRIPLHSKVITDWAPPHRHHRRTPAQRQ